MTKEHELNPVKMIYLDFSSKQKPSYRVSINWILIQDLKAKKKRSLFTRAKYDLSGKVTSFFNKMKTMKENDNLSICDNAGKSKTLEENCAVFFKKSTLNLRH